MRMHADEHGSVAMLDVAADQGNVRLAAIDFAGVGDQSKLAEARVDENFAYAIHVALVRHAVADEFGDGKHLHVVLAAELDKIGDAGHAAIIFHDFADDSGGNHAGEARQI